MTMAPDAVRDVNAFFFGGEHHIAVRLLADTRMEQVWKTLRKEGSDRELANSKEFKDSLNSLPDNYRMETWGASAPSALADRVCASFFLAASIIFGVGNRTVKKYDIEQEAKRWRAGAALCREALSNPHRATVDPDLTAAPLLRRRAINAPPLAELVFKSHASAAFVEAVGPRPGEGAVGAFAFGGAKGLCEGVLAAAGIPVTWITPPTWKRIVGIPPGKEGAKDAARSEAIRCWPDKAAWFARVKDHGRAESCLIGWAGLQREARNG